MKICTKCLASKPISEFRSDPRFSDGLQSWCLSCRDEKTKGNARRRYTRNRPQRLVKDVKYRLNNKEKVSGYAKIYASKNKEHRAAIEAARRFRKNGATPKWADKELIRDMYIEAKYQQLHVDHIVPLKSPFVCGLHVEANLQLCDPVVNIKKKNKFWPDMWVNQ